MDFSVITGLIPDSAMGWVNAGALLIACSSGVAAAISKLTKNTADDKLAGWLKRAHDLLAGVGLHGASLASKRSAPAAVAAREDAAVRGVLRDHRSR